MLAGELHAIQLQMQVYRTAKVKSQPAWTSLPTERWVYMQWRKRTTSLAPKPLDTLLPASTYLHEGAWETGLARKLVGSPVWLSGSTLTSVVTTLVNTNMAAPSRRQTQKGSLAFLLRWLKKFSLAAALSSLPGPRGLCACAAQLLVGVLISTFWISGGVWLPPDFSHDRRDLIQSLSLRTSGGTPSAL